MIDPITPVDAALDASDKTVSEKEAADVAAWARNITEAREHDEDARKQYARDRRYARGDSGFLVDANIAGTNIDILESFLYAKDPDVDVQPSKSCQPPSIEAIRDAAEEMVEAGGRTPEVQQAGQQAAAQAVLQGMPQQEAMIAGMMAENVAAEQQIQAEFERLQKRYARRLRDAKAYSETLELIIARLWRDATLKPRGRRFVRSGLTIGVGIIKASWQERTAPSPETVAAINDLQANIKLAASQRAAMEDAAGTELDAKRAEYERQLASLQGQAERVIARGFVVDAVTGEDFQVPPGYEIASHLDAPWNAHRIPMLKSAAMAQFGLTAEQMTGAVIYKPRKPQMVQAQSPNEQSTNESATAADADSYVSSGTGTDAKSSTEWVMPWEIWDRDSGHVLTMIEGVRGWVKPAWQPTATTRFYPFFLFTTSEVDGQRHPQSLISRASKLIDEYNRIGSAEAEHRRRIKPKILFLKGQIDGALMTKINTAETGEYVGVETTDPTADMQRLFFAAPYAQIDPALYDRSRIINEIERIFGVQEALSGAVTVAKTAREAEIQQGGFQARSGGRRDALEGVLGDLAQYTAEVARAHMDADDAMAIAGPDALWPAYSGPDDLTSMVRIEIRAGSSGKPNTTAEREAWASQLPLLQNAVMQIGQLRNSLPGDIADSLEKLLEITAERSGDRIDIQQLVPKPGPPPAPMAPGAAPADPNAPPPEAAAPPLAA